MLHTSYCHIQQGSVKKTGSIESKVVAAGDAAVRVRVDPNPDPNPNPNAQRHMNPDLCGTAGHR